MLFSDGKWNKGGSGVGGKGQGGIEGGKTMGRMYCMREELKIIKKE